MNEALLPKLTAYIDSLYTEQGVPSCECIIRREHEVIYHHLVGYSDEARTVPASERDYRWLYSCTKLYACTAVMQLIERGLIGLHHPVARYLPEYAHMNVKHEGGVVPCDVYITIFHLLTMGAGIDYNFDRIGFSRSMLETGGLATTRELVKALAADPLDFVPGSHFVYGLCHDILGAVVEVVTGMTFDEYIKKNLFEPLGIKDITFLADAEQLARLSTEYERGDDGSLTALPNTEGYKISPNFKSGGSGFCGTASDYILLPDALANGGVGVTGARILSQETIDLMRENHLTPAQKADFNLMKPAEYSYGLGVRTRLERGATGAPVGEFGWDGAAGSYFFIDPEHRLTLMYCQHIMNYNYAFGVIHPTVRDLAYEELL